MKAVTCKSHYFKNNYHIEGRWTESVRMSEPKNSPQGELIDIYCWSEIDNPGVGLFVVIATVIRISACLLMGLGTW
jgi:hypothetical protein